MMSQFDPCPQLLGEGKQRGQARKVGGAQISRRQQLQQILEGEEKKRTIVHTHHLYFTHSKLMSDQVCQQMGTVAC